MTEHNESTHHGVAVMGDAQQVYDAILFDQLMKPNDTEADIPPAQRGTIRAGVQEHVKSGTQVDSGSAEYAQDLFYLNRLFDEMAFFKGNITEVDLSAATPVSFPLIEYLDSPGIRAFLLTDELYGRFSSLDGGVSIPRHSMILVFDTPYPAEELTS